MGSSNSLTYERGTFQADLCLAKAMMLDGTLPTGREEGSWWLFCKDACADGHGPEITAALKETEKTLRRAQTPDRSQRQTQG